MLLSDLSGNPLLLTIPQMDGRYWSIQCCDFFGSTFAMINRRNTPGPATIALVGPNWRGRLPKGVTAVHRSPTGLAILAMRSHFVSDADREILVGLRAGFTSSAGTAAGTAPVIVPAERATDPLADFKLLAAMWSACPPPRADAALLRRFARLSFGPGARPNIAAMPAKLREALTRAEADGFAKIVAATQKIPGGRTANGWSKPNPELGLYRDGDPLYRAMIAQQGIIATPRTENVYMSLQRLPGGALLDGSGRYAITFDPVSLTEADAFWSMHAYQLATFSVIPNALKRYAISSRSAGLQFNPDGSLTVYAQASDPGGEFSANWLPTAAGENFMLITRAYEPKGAIARLEWPGPKVVRRD